MSPGNYKEVVMPLNWIYHFVRLKKTENDEQPLLVH